jgi:S1-C subfamily serine protease
MGVGLYLLIFITNYNVIRTDTSNIANTIPVCTSIKDQYTKVVGATVPIGTDKSEYGTGFAVGNSTTILTAYHVIDGANSIYQNSASGNIPMQVIKTDPADDIALLSISKPTSSYVTITSSYSIGDELEVYGWPGNTFYAGGASLTRGIVSRTITNHDVRTNFPDITSNNLSYIQTDASVNPGNSGGAMFTACGVVGIVDSKSNLQGLNIVSEQGISYGSEQGISYGISSSTVSADLGIPLTNK